ncbi:hypothetical protein I552_5415 [Mycobacterium xenopi 3993]|nr:hypothetical protein I552_5415 [Mycobacterium xenopi 3993]
MTVVSLLQAIPPVAVYLVVGAVVGIESLGVPLPGEVVLVTAALMSSHHELAVNPIGVGVAGVIGAAVGDSIGYTIGRRLGMPLFDWLGRRFPKHFSPGHIALAERTFDRWGCGRCFSGGLSHCCGYSPDRWPARSRCVIRGSCWQMCPVPSAGPVAPPR